MLLDQSAAKWLSHKPEEFDVRISESKTSIGNSGLLSNMYKREGSNSIF